MAITNLSEDVLETIKYIFLKKTKASNINLEFHIQKIIFNDLTKIFPFLFFFKNVIYISHVKDQVTFGLKVED